MSRNRPTSTSAIALIAGSAILMLSLQADAAKTAPAQMPPPAEKADAGPVELIVSGASAGISPVYFEEHLAQAILEGDVFPPAANAEVQPYRLEVRITRIEAPSFAFRMTVDMKAVWNLRKKADEETLLDEVILSSYTGNPFEGGLIGANRVRVAAEGAARENIRQGIEKITALGLTTP